MALAIICSGGDAPGMNPAIKKFVDYATLKGLKTYFIYDGLEGLIDNKIKEASYKDVAGIMHLGGTIIRSSRSQRFYEYSYRQQAYKNLQKHNIDGLLVLGGDGSFRAMEKFSTEFPINFVGIPSTIDNDIYGSQYSLGVDTSLNVIRDALDKIRDTASSFNRAFVVEVMGRECGYLAAVSAVVSGAEICVIPEIDFPKEAIEKKLQKELENGRNYILAIVAEGTGQTAQIHSWLEATMGMETRTTVLGHVQRGGNPTVYDRLMAFDFVMNGVDYLLENKDSNKVVVFNDGNISFVSIETVVSNHYKLPQYLLNAIHYLD